jgi:hypothetical protein
VHHVPINSGGDADAFAVSAGDSVYLPLIEGIAIIGCAQFRPSTLRECAFRAKRMLQ